MSEDKAFLKSVNKFAVFITIFIDVCMVIGYLAAWFYEEYPFRYVCFVFVIMIVGMSISVAALRKWHSSSDMWRCWRLRLFIWLGCFLH